MPFGSGVSNIPRCPDSSRLNLDDLVDSTIESFELLVPWCSGQESGSKAGTMIRAQACSYAIAIDKSIIAAQYGFNTAREVLTIVRLSKACDKKGTQEHWKDMLKWAERGKKNAIDAQKEFRNVRVILMKLIEQAKRDPEETHDIDQLDTLKSHIPVLERFSEQVSQFASWWNGLEMQNGSQHRRTMMLQSMYNQVREASVVAEWMKLEDQYVDYTSAIKDLTELNPDYKTILQQALAGNMSTSR